MLLSPAFHQHVAEGKMRLTVDTRLNYDDLLMEIERQKEVLIASKRLEELLRPRVPPKMPASMPLPIRKPASPASPPPTAAAQQSSFFPFNPSLEDELNRLFANSLPSPSPPKTHDNEVWEEFRHNGKDFEYCPDPDGPVIQVQPTKKKSKKPLPTECVFCKNNGEDVKIYKKHLLKDADGKILCPILRKYTCPLCGCNGDLAHTVKYCPNNKQPQLLAPMNALKSLRNSTGRRRSK